MTTQNVSQLNWQQLSVGDAALLTVDSAINANWAVTVNGTDAASNPQVLKYVVIDNLANNGIVTFSYGPLSFAVAPFTRKTFPVISQTVVVNFNLTVGAANVIFATFNPEIPDDVNQVAAAAAGGTVTIKGFAGATNVNLNAPDGTKKVNVSADRVALTDASNNVQYTSNFSAILDISTNGVGGLDTGAVAANTWYAVHAIGDNVSTVGGLISLSVKSPTLPNGYLNWYFLGFVLTDGSSNTVFFVQNEKDWSYQSPKLLANGPVGSVTVPTYSAIILDNAGTNAIPANHVDSVRLRVSTDGALAILAPNNTYGAQNSTTKRPLVVGIASTFSAIDTNFVLETNTIYFAGNAGATSAVYLLGFRIT